MDNEFKRLQQLAGIKEIKIQDPTKLNINNLEIGDKLLVKHTDPFVAFVFRVGQVWEVVNIDENYEHYRLVNVNTQTSLGFSKRDLSEMIDDDVFEYYKEPRVNEIKVKNPVVSRLVEEIIDLDKDFFKHTQNLWREEAYELFGKYESDLKNILSLPNVDDIMSSYDNMREYLNTQTPETLNELKEYLKNKLKEFGKQVDEITVRDPTIPNIDEFGNKNIEEIKKLVGYEGYTIVSTFKKTRDKDAAYAVFSKLINSTNRKIILISFDPEFFAANYIKTANINKKTVYYVKT